MQFVAANGNGLPDHRVYPLESRVTMLPDSQTGHPHSSTGFERQKSSAEVLATLCGRRVVCIAIFFFAMTVLVSFLSVLVISKTTNIFVTDLGSGQPACRPCPSIEEERMSRVGRAEVKRSVSPEDLSIWRSCCIRNQGLEEIIQKIVRLQPPGENGRSAVNDSAHVFLRLTASARRTYNSIENTEHATICDWSKDGNAAIVRSGVQLDASTYLTVRDAGLYFVYSRLEFISPREATRVTSDVSSAARDEPILFSQQIYEEDSDEHLLEDAQLKTCVRSEIPGQPCHMSNLFSVLYLRKGSQLYVKAKPVAALSDRQQASFFGLFRIG